MKKVLVVGAGCTGAIVSDLLSKANLGTQLSVAMWEKARGCGGRMATTRFPSADREVPLTADVGAQYISSSPYYQNVHAMLYKQLLTNAVLEPFKDQHIDGEHNLENGTKNFMCPQGINSIAKHFIKSSGADIKFETRASSLSRAGDSILVEADNGASGEFDCVILTMPVPQILALDGIDNFLDRVKKSQLSEVKYSGRYAVAVKLPGGFDPPVNWSAKYIKTNDCVRYISIDTKKRGIADGPHSLVIHTSVGFGMEHLEEDKDKVGEMVLDETRKVIDWLPARDKLELKAHKWRYSQVRNSVIGSKGYMTISKSPTVVLCGDAFTHSNLDGCMASAINTVNSLTA